MSAIGDRIRLVVADLERQTTTYFLLLETEAWLKREKARTQQRIELLQKLIESYKDTTQNTV